MLHYVRCFSPVFVLCAAVFVDSAALAQERPPADSQPGYRAKQVLGSKMLIQGNVAIGTVDDIVFADDGQVEYLVVVNEGKLVAVPWEAAKFNFDQRTAVVNITQDQFRQIPTFTVERYPSLLAPTYRAQIYGFYGLKPRDFRGKGVITPPPVKKKKP